MTAGRAGQLCVVLIVVLWLIWLVAPATSRWFDAMEQDEQEAVLEEIERFIG